MQCIGLSMSLQQMRFLRYNRNNTRKGNMIHKWCALEKLVEMVQSKTPSIESLKVAQRPKVMTAKGLSVKNVANFYANLNNFTSFITTTHPTSKIVTNQEHKLDKVVKERSFKNVKGINIPNSTFSKGRDCPRIIFSTTKMVSQWPCNPKLGWPISCSQIGLLILSNLWAITWMTFLLGLIQQFTKLKRGCNHANM